MTAIDINAEVLRQLSIISNNKSYLEKTLDFLKGLTSQKGSQTVRGAAYQKMLKSLSDYQEYERGWDDDDALPLYAAVVRNVFRRVHLSPEVSSRWH